MTLELENKRWDSLFVLPIFDGVIINGHPIFWVVDAGVPRIKYWMPIHYDTIEDGQSKKSHLLFSFLARIVLFFAFYRRDLFVKNIITSFHWFHFNNFTLRKIHVSIQETKFIAWRSFVMWVNSFIDASDDTRWTRELNAQLPRVIAERVIHHLIVMDGWSFGRSQWNFLLTS